MSMIVTPVMYENPVNNGIFTMSTGDRRISEPSTVLVMMIVVIFKTCQKERIRRPKGLRWVWVFVVFFLVFFRSYGPPNFGTIKRL